MNGWRRLTRTSWVLIVVTYYCLAMLTGTYWYQHRRDPARFIDGGMAAVVTGLGWPLYWSGCVAMKITE